MKADPRADPSALAALQALAFAGQPPAPWSPEAFAGLLDDPAVALVAEAGGFALGRQAGPEAELLTLAVHPAARRRGLGRRLVLGFERGVAGAGAGEAFLEVAETNGPARALYAGLGYLEVGRRRRYYRLPGQPAADALVLRKLLAPRQDSI